MPRLKTEETTNISLRVPTALLERIDGTASRLGITRTEYLLSWLPDQHQRTAPQAPNTAAKNTR